MVCESGHPNSGGAEHIFNDIKKELGEGGRLLAGISFLDKGECDPLALADFIAHSRYLDGPELKFLGLSDSPKKASGATLRHLRFSPEGLALAKTNVIKSFEARRAWGSQKTQLS